MLVEGVDADDGESAASSSRPRSTTTIAPLDPVPLRRHRAPDDRAVRVRPHARADVAGRPQERRDRRRRPFGAADRRVGRGRDGRRVRDGPVPGDPHRARGRPAAPARRLRARVASRARRGARRGARPRCCRRVGVEPDVELVPNEALLRLGPPHKIPRVATAVTHADVALGDRVLRRRRRAGARRGGSRTTRSTATSATRQRGARRARRRGHAACCGARCSREAGQMWPYVCGTVLAGAPPLVRRRDRAARRCGSRCSCA